MESDVGDSDDQARRSVDTFDYRGMVWHLLCVPIAVFSFVGTLGFEAPWAVAGCFFFASILGVYEIVRYRRLRRAREERDRRSGS